MRAHAGRRGRAAWFGPMKAHPDHSPLPAAYLQFDPRRHARSLFWRGWGVSQIADEFALHGVVNDKGGPIARSTIDSWKQRDAWEDAPSIRKIEDGLEIRLLTLIAKDQKSMISSISKICEDLDVNISGLNAKANKDETVVINLNLSIQNKEQMEKIIRSLKNVPGIMEAYRTKS